MYWYVYSYQDLYILKNRFKQHIRFLDDINFKKRAKFNKYDRRAILDHNFINDQ